MSREYSPIRMLAMRLNNQKTPQKIQKPDKDSNEDMIFSAIVAVFIIGLMLFSQGGITGRIIYENNTDTINISTLYTHSTNVTFVLKGNLTSLRISGQILGNGTARITLGEKILLDSRLLPESEGNLITGMVVQDLTESEEPENFTGLQSNYSEESDTNESKGTIIPGAPALSENGTNEPESLNDTQELMNDTTTLLEYNISGEVISEEIPAENISEYNITENNPLDNNVSNDSVQEDTPAEEEHLDIVELDRYCLETCLLNGIPKEITLVITLDDCALNVTTIHYTYLQENAAGEPAEESAVNASIDNLSNLSIRNDSLNLSQVINDSLIAVAVNLSSNASENITYNATGNLSAELNFTAYNASIIYPVLNSTEILASKLGSNMTIISFKNTSDGFTARIGIDEHNFAEVTGRDPAEMDHIRISFMPSEDARLVSNIISLENTSARINLGLSDADLVLKCIQYENGGCMRWQKTNISLTKQNDTISADLEQGIYALSVRNISRPEYLTTASVYLNMICPGCEEDSNCKAEKFCLAREQNDRLFSFISQFNFDIFSLQENIHEAELCVYVYDSYDGSPSSAYAVDSPRGFCGALENNRSSGLVSSKLIKGFSGWECLPITEILQSNVDAGYSNMFIDWTGEELGGAVGPYNCYLGIASLDSCNGFNPSGAEDCRPYIRLSSKESISQKNEE